MLLFELAASSLVLVLQLETKALEPSLNLPDNGEISSLAFHL